MHLAFASDFIEKTCLARQTLSSRQDGWRSSCTVASGTDIQSARKPPFPNLEPVIGKKSLPKTFVATKKQTLHYSNLVGFQP
jgi:hypothetical protein